MRLNFGPAGVNLKADRDGFQGDCRGATAILSTETNEWLLIIDIRLASDVASQSSGLWLRDRKIYEGREKCLVKFCDFIR